MNGTSAALGAFFFVFGLSVGSFIANYSKRTARGESALRGRSRCPHCEKTLGFPELVPVIGYLLVRGRCRACGQAIGLFYPAVELGAGLLSLWAFLVLPGWLAFAGALLAWALLAAALVDAHLHILPDSITLPLIPLGLGVTWINLPERLPNHIAGALAGFLAIVAIMILYKYLRKRDGIGLGDAKLLAAAGAWLGAAALPSVVVMASLGGLAWLALTTLRGEALAANRRLAFGPFLAGAFWLVWLYGPLSFPGSP